MRRGYAVTRASSTTPSFVFLAALLVSAACGGSKPPADLMPTGGGSATASGPSSDSAGGSATTVAVAKPAPPTPPDPALLTCKTAGEQPPPGICGALERAPRADAAKAKRTIEIWRRLEAPFAAMTGRETALVVLGPDAKKDDGTAIEAAATICPGAPPTVYVPASLLALVDAKDPKKFPEDFLAFVIGHELGHRMNDLTPDGCVLGTMQRPGKGFDEEELADARSAFFITSAGFSAGKVAREDMVSTFLQNEYKLTAEDTASRKTALMTALSRFDSYEALYQTALNLALGGNYEQADRLLTWADELVQSHGVPLPELRVVRAITRINRAAEMAPWLGKDLGVPVSIAPLKCTAIHPGHSSLHEEPAAGVRGPDVEYGRKLLKEALVLLGEAEARGATPFTVASARMCANLYLADAPAAGEAQARAELLAPANAPSAVKQALADNRSLLTFLEFARKKAPPAAEAGDAVDAWTDEMIAAIGASAAAAPGFATVIKNLRKPMSRPDSPPPSTVACTGSKPQKPAALPALPRPTDHKHGDCPKGFKLAYALPTLDAAKNTGTTQGVTVCSPDKPDGSELALVHLAPTTEPAMKRMDGAMLTMRPPAGLESLDTWACMACNTLERQGVSDRGEVVYVAQCPAVQLGAGLLVTVDGTVTAVVPRSIVVPK